MNQFAIDAVLRHTFYPTPRSRSLKSFQIRFKVSKCKCFSRSQVKKEKNPKQTNLNFIPVGIYSWQIKINKKRWILSFSISEIICDVPEILHGYVRSPKASYKETEQLQFACDKGYRYGERADARCTASGWNPTPYCTGIPYLKLFIWHIFLCVWK